MEMPSERDALGSLATSAIRASVVIAGARDLELNRRCRSTTSRVSTQQPT
jgi:hypothetical protein